MALMLPLSVNVNAVPPKNVSRRSFIPVGEIGELPFVADEFTKEEIEVIKNTPFLASRLEAAADKGTIIGYRDNYKNSEAKLEARQVYNYATKNPKEFLKSEFPAYLGSGDEKAAIELVQQLNNFGETPENIQKLYEASLPDAVNYGQTYEEKRAINIATQGSNDPFRKFVEPFFTTVGAIAGGPVGAAITNSIVQLQNTGKIDPVKTAKVAALTAAPSVVKNVLPAEIASIPGAAPAVTGTVSGLLSGQNVEDALKTGAISGTGSVVGSTVAGSVAPTVGTDLAKAAGTIAGGTTAGLLSGRNVEQSLISSTISAGANLAGTTAGNLVNRNLFGNTPQTGAGTMDDFSNGGIQLFDDGSSIFFDNSGNVVGGIDNTGSQFNAPNFDLQIFDDGTFIARDAQGNFSFSTTDAPLFTGNAVVGTIGSGLASNAPSSLVQNLTAKAASSAASSATRSLLSRLLGGASSALNQALGTGTTEASLGALLGGLLNRGIDYATAEKIANQVRQEGQAIQQAATTAGAEAAVPFTPYTVSSGLGTTTVGPTGATTALAPEYGDIRTQALGQAAQTLGAINPAQASQTLFGQLEGLQAPARQREQEQLLSRLGASGLLGIGRNLPTVGGGIAGVNPYLESLLSAQGTQQAQNALAATQFGAQEAQRQQALSQSLLGMGTGLDTLGTQQLSQTGALGQLPLSAQQLNAQRQLEATLTGLRSGVPFSTTAANIQAGQTGLLGQTAQDLVKEIFG